MPSKHSFQDWPQESIDRFAQIIADLVVQKMSKREATNTDAAYLASLTKAEYDRLIKGGKK